MSEAAEKIERLRRKFVEACGTPDEPAARAALKAAIDEAKTEQPSERGFYYNVIVIHTVTGTSERFGMRKFALDEAPRVGHEIMLTWPNGDAAYRVTISQIEGSTMWVRPCVGQHLTPPAGVTVPRTITPIKKIIDVETRVAVLKDSAFKALTVALDMKEGEGGEPVLVRSDLARIAEIIAKNGIHALLAVE